MISQEDIEQCRTSTELCEFVELTRSRVEANRAELKIARRRTGIYKMFVDEVMPLALASKYICDSNDRILPVRGSQGYDANVYDIAGNLKERIEIAKPYDGEANFNDISLMEKHGYGEIRVRNMGECLSEIADLIIKTAKDKAQKDYSDCTLLFAAIIDPLDDELPEIEEQTKRLCETLKTIRYIARRVVLVVPPLPTCYVIQSYKEEHK